MKLALTHQAGISLIEVMLSCAIGIMLIQGVIDIYSSNKQTFILQEAFARIQENARFSRYFLTQNIRMAGELSCEQSLDKLDSSGAIHGYQGNPPASIKNKIRKGTDSVVVKRCRLNNGAQHVEEYAFIVSATSRKNKIGEIVYALYEAPLSGDKIELVPNVTDMQILYGVPDADGNIQGYLEADQVLDWEVVKAVEVRLLLSSEDPVLADPEVYKFGGKMLPGSRYLQREWEVYIALRERF